MNYYANEIIEFVQMAEAAKMEPLDVKQAASILMRGCQSHCEVCSIMAAIDEKGDTCHMKQFDVASKLIDKIFQAKVLTKVSFYINAPKSMSGNNIANIISDIIIDNKSAYLIEEEDFEIVEDKEHLFIVEKLD